MIEKNKHSNLLEQAQYKYSLQDVDEPNLYREIYPYDEVPRLPSTTDACRYVCPTRYG